LGKKRQGIVSARRLVGAMECTKSSPAICKSGHCTLAIGLDIFAFSSLVNTYFALSSLPRLPVVESAAAGLTENSPLRDRRLYSLLQVKARTVEQVGILIIDDDASSQAAMRQVLGSEGWLVEGASSTAQAFKELASRKWALVLANTGTTGNTGPLFDTLRELAQPPEGEATKAHVRVLFVVPESASAEAAALLEEDHLPYVVKPFTFHDLLERVSDLLMETQAIGAPLRKVKQEGLKSTRRTRNAGRDPGRDGARNTGMFSNHDYQWSEEELAEYEQQDTEAMRKKKKKPLTLG
jgi:DNA-binding response OmpR family regulator